MSQPLTLDQWLARIEAGHPTEIEMGLSRVAEVARAMQIDLSFAKVITVAGTNGKGSTTKMLDCILSAAGFATGVYTSPHFVQYNERIRIRGCDASDEDICDAFSIIDQCRGDVSLTYFEYGTLAAFWLFQHTALDFIILEVGLGGRLDAVNIIDADIAILTSVSLDHVEWLGDSLDKIGYEKAGVFRTNRPAVCGMFDPPRSVIDHAQSIGTSLYRRGIDFDMQEQASHWRWQGINAKSEPVVFDDLLIPSLPLQNAASVVQALVLMVPTIDPKIINDGLSRSKMTGRMQVESLGDTPMILDVAHNPEAALYLAQRVLKLQTAGKVRLILGMLADKDREAVINALAPVVSEWHFVSLKGPRASSAQSLASLASSSLDSATFLHANVADAVEKVARAIEYESQHRAGFKASDDLVLVCGSFLTVTEALKWLTRQA